MMMVTSASGVKAIAQHEGLVLETYEDPIGILTIGYGHTGSEAFPGNKITQKKAMQLLKEDLKTAEAIIAKYVKVPLTQPQLDALVSFVLNVGPGAKGKKDGFVRLKNGRQSTILRKLNEGDYFGAAEELPKWKNAGGKPLRGLIIRRAEERALFLSGTSVEEPLDSNIEPDAPSKPPIGSSKPVQALAGTGIAGTLSMAAEAVSPLSEYSDYLKILWVCLVIAGIGYFIYSRKEV
jgi:lysozyme